MKTWLLPVYSDNLMHIEQLVPYKTNKTLDDINSHTCLHTGDPTRIRQLVTKDRDLFVLFPRTSGQHYFFGSKSVPAHNSLFINSLNEKIDKWSMVGQFPGLWEFFRSSTFRETTINYPIIFWHVPPADHQQVISSIKNNFIKRLNTDFMQDLRYPLQDEILPNWMQDDWNFLYRLVEATVRSSSDRVYDIAQSYAEQLTINEIDLKVNRLRLLKNILIENLLQSTLIGKLMSAMKSVQDPRTHTTEFAIIDCLAKKIDQVLADVIQEHLGK